VEYLSEPLRFRLIHQERLHTIRSCGAVHKLATLAATYGAEPRTRQAHLNIDGSRPRALNARFGEFQERHKQIPSADTIRPIPVRGKSYRRTVCLPGESTLALPIYRLATGREKLPVRLRRVEREGL
jgi:hypothetical protein